MFRTSNQTFFELTKSFWGSLLRTVLILVIMGWTPASPSEWWSLSPAYLSSVRRLFLGMGMPSSSRASTSLSKSSWKNRWVSNWQPLTCHQLNVHQDLNQAHFVSCNSNLLQMDHLVTVQDPSWWIKDTHSICGRCTFQEMFWLMAFTGLDSNNIIIFI